MGGSNIILIQRPAPSSSLSCGALFVEVGFGIDPLSEILHVIIKHRFSLENPHRVEPYAYAFLLKPPHTCIHPRYPSPIGDRAQPRQNYMYFIAE